MADPGSSVNCYTCARVAWSGKPEDMPYPSGKTVLIEFAKKNCDRKDCPHKPEAVKQAQAQDPEVMAGEIKELKASVQKLLAKDVG